MTKTNEVLQEEFDAETKRLKEIFTTKELAFNSERDLLIKKAQTESAAEIFNRKKKSIAKIESKPALETLKDKAEDSKDASKFLKKELEDYKKLNTNIMKENSVLRNEIIELTGENEMLAKNTTQLTRKVDELSTKLKRSDTKSAGERTPAKTSKLREQRMSKKALKEDPKLSRASQAKLCTSVDNLQKSVTTMVSEEAKAKDESLNFGLEFGSESPEPSSVRVAANKLSPDFQPVSIMPAKVNEFLRRSNERSKFASVYRGKFENDDPTAKALKKASIIGNDKFKASVIKDGNMLSSSPTLSESSKWKCIHNEELHSYGIFSLASFDHYLISSSNVIKLWDINRTTTAKEIAGTNAKTLYVIPNYKLLMSASEQQGSVIIYGLPNLEVVKTIETGLEAVRAIYVDKSIVFIGGNGPQGALQLWDMNTMSKLCDKEKSQDKDIFSILCKRSVIYYGGRNRCINRINFNTLVSLLLSNVGKYACIESDPLWGGERAGEFERQPSQRMQGVPFAGVELRDSEGEVHRGEENHHAQHCAEYLRTKSS